MSKLAKFVSKKVLLHIAVAPIGFIVLIVANATYKSFTEKIDFYKMLHLTFSSGLYYFVIYGIIAIIVGRLLYIFKRAVFKRKAENLSLAISIIVALLIGGYGFLYTDELVNSYSDSLYFYTSKYPKCSEDTSNGNLVISCKGGYSYVFRKEIEDFKPVASSVDVVFMQ